MSTNDFKWRPIAEVPDGPMSALVAVFNDEDDRPCILDGIWITQRGRWVREDSLDDSENPPANSCWIDEEAVFKAYPLVKQPSPITDSK